MSNMLTGSTWAFAGALYRAFEGAEVRAKTGISARSTGEVCLVTTTPELAVDRDVRHVDPNQAPAFRAPVFRTLMNGAKWVHSWRPPV